MKKAILIWENHIFAFGENFILKPLLLLNLNFDPYPDICFHFSPYCIFILNPLCYFVFQLSPYFCDLNKIIRLNNFENWTYLKMARDLGPSIIGSTHSTKAMFRVVNKLAYSLFN